MRFELDPAQRDLVREIDLVLAETGPAADPRETLAVLGERRLLAVHFSIEYGGRGLTLAHQAAVAARIGERGLPDVVHLVTVQGVGCAILAFGTEEQRRRYLPSIAAGRSFASLMLSEPNAGSDISRIETKATADGDGWRITGLKTWLLWTDWSHFALCSARTRSGANRYDGISLFLVDLAAPGVELMQVARSSPQPYFTVRLRDVRVDHDALLGPLHKAWSLVPAIVGFERGGFDYLSRGWAWLEAALKVFWGLPLSEQEALCGEILALRCGLENAQTLAYHAAHEADGLHVEEVLTAYVKLACGRAAQAVARFAGQELLPRCAAAPEEPAQRVLRAAIAEAPELTISGGSLELQLDLIAFDFPIGRAATWI